MEIKNKIESVNVINQFELNKLEEQLFSRGEEQKVVEFLNKFPYKFYAIRDKSKSGGKFKFNVKKEDVLKEIQNYDLFSINVSSGNFKNSQILTGDIQVFQDGRIYAILSCDPEASVRDAYARPDFNISTDIFDDKTLCKIPGFDFLLNYIFEHNLFDVIIEFSLFNTNVGVKKEKIVIFELRTNY